MDPLSLVARYREHIELQHRTLDRLEIMPPAVADMLAEFDLDDLRENLELARCIGADAIGGVIDLVLEPFEEFKTQSGAPDLLVWSEQESIWFFAEVKGPGDYIRPSQVAWLERAWDTINGRFALILLHQT